jgi:hypothetical protein
MGLETLADAAGKIIEDLANKIIEDLASPL